MPSEFSLVRQALSLLSGAVLGIVVGVLPGIGPGVTIAVLLPFTYGMAPMAGICLLPGVYCGAFYGGSSILIHTPGEASSIMTMFDGYPMARRGEAQRAPSLAFMAAFAGGIVSALLLGLAALTGRMSGNRDLDCPAILLACPIETEGKS